MINTDTLQTMFPEVCELFKTKYEIEVFPYEDLNCFINRHVLEEVIGILIAFVKPYNITIVISSNVTIAIIKKIYYKKPYIDIETTIKTILTISFNMITKILNK